MRLVESLEVQPHDRLLTVTLIVVMVAVVVAPRPILLLFFRWQSAKIPIGIAVCLVGPAAVIDGLAIIPDVVVRVVRIVDASIMMFAGDSGK